MPVNLVFENQSPETDLYKKQNITSKERFSESDPIQERYRNILSLIFQRALAATELTTPYPNHQFVQEIHRRCLMQTQKLEIVGRWAVFQAPQPGAHPFVASDCLFFDVGLKTVSFGDHVYHQYIAVSFA